MAWFDGRAAPTVNARGTRALWRQSQRRLLANTLLHGRVADSREVSQLGIPEDLRSFGHWGGRKNEAASQVIREDRAQHGSVAGAR